LKRSAAGHARLRRKKSFGKPHRRRQ
jgi:hypothetical protein